MASITKSPSKSEFSPAVSARLEQVTDDLSSSLSRVIDAVPGGPHRPRRLAARLGLNVVLTSRLLRAIGDSDAARAMHLMPGPEPLGRFLAAARGAGVAEDVLERAAAAVARFRDLLAEEFGDRGSLATLVAASHGDLRPKLELTARQAIFRGQSQLRGVIIDRLATAYVLWPNPTGDTLDMLVVQAALGVRRLRPDALVRCAIYDPPSLPSGTPTLQTLTGGPVRTLQDMLLPEFCSGPTPRFETEQPDGSVQFTLAEPTVGASSAVDIVQAYVRRAAAPLHRSEGRSLAAFWLATEDPTRRLVLDVLAPPSIWPGITPSRRVYETAVRGVARVNDPSRDKDMVDRPEPLAALGRFGHRTRSEVWPRMGDALSLATTRLGWDASSMSVHRCDLEYPLYGSQICAVFELPERAPGTSRGQ